MAKRSSHSEAKQDRDFARAMRVLRKHCHQLLKRKGVTGVDVNYRVRAGKRTNEVVIRVQVVKKLPVSELRGNQIIRSVDGVPTDVVELKNDYQPTAVVVAGQGIAAVIDGDVGNLGTFGVTCFDKASGKKRGLTNAHVVFGGRTKSSLPSKIPIVRRPGGASIGQAIRNKCFLTSSVDCGLIEPATDADFQLGVPNLMKPPGAIGELKRKHVRDRVTLRKLGAKTGETSGKLSSITQSFTAKGKTFLFQIA
ncbi:MAG: hypothetical protein MI861_09320, partial [Pirellulales bacterium]|nr:hypothetical protein [Pirellulales bacterium]